MVVCPIFWWFLRPSVALKRPASAVAKMFVLLKAVASVAGEKKSRVRRKRVDKENILREDFAPDGTGHFEQLCIKS